jgi:hypothetical protein
VEQLVNRLHVKSSPSADTGFLFIIGARPQMFTFVEKNEAVARAEKGLPSAPPRGGQRSGAEG